MSNGVKGKVGINKEPYKQPPYADNSVQITITPDEKEYLTDMAVIMSKLKVNEANSTLIPDKTLSALGKMALNLWPIFIALMYSKSQKLRPICQINRP